LSSSSCAAAALRSLPPCGGGLGWGDHGNIRRVDPHPQPLPARGRGEEIAFAALPPPSRGRVGVGGPRKDSSFGPRPQPLRKGKGEEIARGRLRIQNDAQCRFRCDCQRAHRCCHCEERKRRHNPESLRRDSLDFSARNDGASHTTAFSPREAPESLPITSSLREQRAQGRPGARRTRGPRAKKMHGAGTTGEGGITPAFPARMVLTAASSSPR